MKIIGTYYEHATLCCENNQLLPFSEEYKKNNFALIGCLTNFAPSVGGNGGRLSDACEHVIWNYKVKLTNDRAFAKEVKSVSVL